MWYQSEFPNIRIDWLTRIQIRNKIYWSYFKFIYVHKYKILFCREMEGVEASTENESHHNNPSNIYVELNNQPS